MHIYDDYNWVDPAELEKMARCLHPWEWYLFTKVYFETPELSGTVCPVDSDGEEYPPLGPLHVITAVQPGSEPDSDESTARIEVLDGELKAAGISSIRAVGISLDDDHYREESRAVFGLNDDQALKLGRRFGQVAVFSWTGPRWSLLASAGNRQAHRAWRWYGPNPPVPQSLRPW